MRNAMDASQLIFIAISEEYQSCPVLRAEAEHAIMLSKAGHARVYILCTQPYFCPFWDKDHDSDGEPSKVTKSQLTRASIRLTTGEPCEAGNCREAALQLLANDERANPYNKQLFAHFLPPSKPHQPLSGWIASLIPQGGTWFGLWSQGEAERLPDYVQAHLRNGLPGQVIATSIYNPHMFT